MSDLKVVAASISSAICGLRRIIIVFFFQTNKMNDLNGINFTYVRLSKITMGKYADFGLQFSFNHQLNMKGHTD